MEYVIKRDGKKVPFDKSKIVNAIEKAMTCTPGGIDARVSNAIADYIADMPDILSVEQIQDIVVDSLKNSPFSDVAEAYSQWRKYRQEIRERQPVRRHGRGERLARTIAGKGLKVRSSAPAPEKEVWGS